MAEDHGSHQAIERAERVWIVFSLALIAVFVVLVFYMISSHGAHVGQVEARQPAAEILAMPEFADPGVVELEPGRYRAHVVARAFSFTPSLIEVPVGSEVEFHLTSADVIHGFNVKGTTINVEVIPGEISTLRYTFDSAGDYPVICNQYCGVAHHNMITRIRVVDPGTVEAVAEVESEPEETLETGWDPARGEHVYANQCAACHQGSGAGVPGAFPPLAGHMPALYADGRGRQYLIQVVLYGVQGPIEAGGRSYDSVMVPMGRLSDEDVAAALNHALHAWGNDEALPAGFDPVLAEEVTEERGLELGPRDVLTHRPAVAND